MSKDRQSAQPDPAPVRRLAFGVDPRRPQRYSLRQSRYDALAADIAKLAEKKAAAGGRLSVLDIGCGPFGSLALHLQARPVFQSIDLHGADLAPFEGVSLPLYRTIVYGDFADGYPEIPDNSFDVVVCEQVLEHLHEQRGPMQCVERILKPGGTAFIGVPIFLPPLDWLRRHLVPKLDPWLRKPGLPRHHVQAYTAAAFRRALRTHTKLKLHETRDFRIVSGGILRPLEEHRWWWRLNRWLGRYFSAACIEIQEVASKRAKPTTAI